MMRILYCLNFQPKAIRQPPTNSLNYEDLQQGKWTKLTDLLKLILRNCREYLQTMDLNQVLAYPTVIRAVYGQALASITGKSEKKSISSFIIPNVLLTQDINAMAVMNR